MPAHADGGFLADAIGDADFADRSPDVPGVQQRLGLAPDAGAVAVELKGDHPVHGVAPPLLADPVVALGGLESGVVHQLFEDVWGHAGVRMPLRVAVPVGVGEDPALIEWQ